MFYLRLHLLFLYVATTSVFAADQWEQRADFGSFGRHRAVAIGIGNKAYAGTGHINGTGVDDWFPDWWEYDPGTNAWTQKADFIGNNGNGDQDITAISINNLGYIGLGQLDGLGYYQYDPQNNQWTPLASPPPNGDFNNTFPFAIGQYGYYPALNSTNFFRYDTATDTWTQLNPLPFTNTYGVPTFSLNGKGYIKKGTAFYAYDPATDSWSPKAPFPGSTPNRPRAFVQNGYGYFIGGMTTFTNWSNEVWRYDATNDTWLQMQDFPGSTRRWAVICMIGQKVFYGLGTNGTNFNDFWEFDATANFTELSFSTLQIFPNPSSDLVHFQWEEVEPFEVTLFDSQGRSVANAASTNGKAIISGADLPRGVYIAHATVKGKVQRIERIVFH